MTVNNEFIIRKAEHHDINDILIIAQNNILKSITEDVSRENGFLVSDFSINDYLEFIQNADDARSTT